MLVCCYCGFEAKARNGLVLHQRAIHARQAGNGIPSSKRPRLQGEFQECGAATSEGGTSGQGTNETVSSHAAVLLDPVHDSPLPTVAVVPPSGEDGGGQPVLPGPVESAVAGQGDGQALLSLRPDATGSYDAAIRAQLETLMAMTGVERQGDETVVGGRSSRTRRQPVRGFDFQTLSTNVRALYEVLDDAARSVPIVERRKHSRPRQFNTRRLRALQQFVLGVGGAGLSRREQRLLYAFLDVWDDHGQDSPMDATEDFSLRAVFPTPNAFVNALRDDLDDAVLSEGWKKVTVKEGGIEFEVCYRPALDVLLNMLSSSKNVALWSGETGPAPPMDKRETPMDGDAFRLCEEDVVANHGESAFVMGIHLYSDSSQLSWSGGEFDRPNSGQCVFVPLSFLCT